MEDTNVTAINTRAKIAPLLMLQRGGITLQIGIKLADKGGFLEDKVKRMIRKDVQSGNL